MEWYLFLSQLPTNTSSLRVNVWRKLRSAGALGLQNGVWVLPKGSEQIAFLRELLGSIQEMGASGQIFTISPVEPQAELEILDRFRVDRDEEYAEFLERSQEFLAEIEKESGRGKYTFAELEENEQDLQRLSKWLEKIRKRDFAEGEAARQAAQAFENCQKAYETFAATVYERQAAGSTDGERG